MEENVSESKRTLFSWLTVEVALYGLILALALALRLVRLDLRLMDVPEVTQAWAAWQLASGKLASGDYSPLLLTVQALLFALFGAGDAMARLFPALAGSAMVVLPCFLRSRLGRTGALMTALILAVSPTLVFSARYGDGATLLAVFSLAAVVLWLAWCEERRPGYLWALAVLIPCALLSDPRIVAVLIVLIAAWAVEKFFFKRDVLHMDLKEPLPWKTLAIVSGATLVLMAAAFVFNPSGLGAWADFLAQWAAHLSPVINGQPWYYPLAALMLYEPLLLLFGLIGAIDLLIRKDEAAVFVWAALGLLITALFSGGRDAGDVALACVMLALPAGRALDNLAHNWQKEARLAREGAFVGVALPLLVYLAFEVTLYARSLYIARPEAEQFLWLWLLAVALILVLMGLFLAWFGPEATWRSAGGVLALVLVLASFSAAVGLNFEHADDPKELHVRVAPYQGLRDALKVMRQISAQRYKYPISMPVTVEAGLSTAWRWYLRDWEQVEFVDTLTAEVRAPMVLTSFEEQNPALGDQYTGQDFVTRRWWSPEFLDSTDQLTWWLYRKASTLPVKLEQAILWVQAEE